MTTIQQVFHIEIGKYNQAGRQTQLNFRSRKWVCVHIYLFAKLFEQSDSKNQSMVDWTGEFDLSASTAVTTTAIVITTISRRNKIKRQLIVVFRTIIVY